MHGRHALQELLAARQVRFDGTCGGALKSIVRAVCDYLAAISGHIQPHMESAVINVVRSILLEGVRQHPAASGISAELLATTASWAIYGAAKQWLQTPDRCAAEEISETIVCLVSPILSAEPAPAHS